MDNIFVEFLPPWVETNMQPAFYDKESGTCLQQTARMYDRVNMLVRMFNKLSKQTKETVEEYIDKFNELHDYVMDYFANLDVQEEIDNKLDQMAEDGTLTDIIAEYLKLKGVLAFDNVASLKEATNIVNGSMVETYGYYSAGDGGSAKYKIRNITNDDVIDEMFIIEITADPSNTLIAEYISTGELSTKQVGIVGDGTTDETDKLQKFFAYNTSKYIVNSPNILIDGNMSITSNSYIEFEDGCKITRKTTDATHYYMLHLDNVDNVTINNAHLVGDKTTHTGADGQWGHGINVVCSTNILIENSIIEDTWGDGIYIGLYSTKGEYQQVENVKVTNCIIDNCSRNGISVCSGKNILIEDCKISNVTRIAPKAGIDIELEAPAGQTPLFENLVINNIFTSENGEGINVYCGADFNAGQVKVSNHHSYNENRCLYMIGFNNSASVFTYEDSYIELANTFAIIINKSKDSKGYIKNIIVDSSKLADINNSYHGVIGLVNNSDSGYTTGGLVIDGVKVIKTHSDKHIWGTFLMFNSSNTGSIEDITMKNISNDVYNNVGLKPLFFSPSAGTGVYDWSKFAIENCTFERISNSPTVTLSGSDDGFCNLFTKSALWQNSTTTISPKFPNGIYEISVLSKSTYSHVITFDSGYNVYTGTTSGATSRTFTAGYDGAYLKFRKDGSNISIITNLGYTIN